jgi:hypothetical protein
VDGSSGTDTGLGRVSGQTYTRSIVFNSGYGGQPAYVEYDLGRKYSTFQTTMGLSDDAKSDTRILLQVYGDNVELARQEVGLGQPVPVDIPIKDVLRLRLQVTTTSGSNEQLVVFGDARLNP